MIAVIGAAGGAAAAARRLAEEEAAAASAGVASSISVSQNGVADILGSSQVRCLTIKYTVWYDPARYHLPDVPEGEGVAYDYQIGAVILVPSEKKGFFGGTKYEKKTVPLPEAIEQLLLPGAKVVNIAFDWHNQKVRVFYVVNS